jgi:ribonuclease HI
MRNNEVESDSHEVIIAYCDGSALGNPGPSGWAWWIDEERWGAGGFVLATNNVGELEAVADMLVNVPLNQALEVRCDSRYVLDAITKWMPGWKAKNWCKADGSTVKNLEIMQRIDVLVTARTAPTAWVWVKGHSGEAGNERVDTMARDAAIRAQNHNTTPLRGKRSHR